MAMTLGAAVGELEACRYEQAATALGALAGPSGDGIIARFRQAESLSRLGRHDEALEAARQAVSDAPDALAPSLWLMHSQAEAGQYAEAAGLPLPEPEREEVVAVATGYHALAKIAAGDRTDAEQTTQQILATRYSPLYSLALRLAETDRLLSGPRWPDIQTTWAALECRLYNAEYGISEHPTPPAGRKPRDGWLRLHFACDEGAQELFRSLADADRSPDIALELALASGDLDAAAQALETLTASAKKEDLAALAIEQLRLAHLGGEALDPETLPVYAAARKQHAEAITWLQLTHALLTQDTLGARPLADRLADPSHCDCVTAALARWAEAPPPTPETAQEPILGPEAPPADAPTDPRVNPAAPSSPDA